MKNQDISRCRLDELRKEYDALLESGQRLGCGFNRHPDVAQLADIPDDREWLIGLIARMAISLVRHMTSKYL